MSKTFKQRWDWVKALTLEPMQLEEEIHWLYEIIEEVKPRVFVEIGSHYGGTLWLLGDLVQTGGMIASISLLDGSVQCMESTLAHLRHRHTVEWFRSSSQEPSTLTSLKEFLNGQQIDILFIDGDHSLAGVTHDYETYSPLVREGGVIAFHDIAYIGIPTTEVDRLWKVLKVEMCKCGWRYDETPASDRGIGVIWKGKVS